MECREVRERLSEYQDGSLDAVVARTLDTHFRECGECAAAVRSLAAVRELLRSLPPTPAPPELLARVREAVAREEAGNPKGAAGGPSPTPRGGSLLSRLRIPLEAAAAVLLVASIWWYQKGSPPAPTPPAPPARSAAATPATPLKADRPAPHAETAAPKREVASLPSGAPEPKARVYSGADLPAAPALRASTDSERIAPGAPAAAPSAEASGIRTPRSRLFLPPPYEREVLLDVTAEDRGGAEERVAAAARRLGGSVERVDRDPADGAAAVRVILPEPAAPAFLSELERIGKVPPEAKPAGVEPLAGPAPGTVAYTVRIRIP